MTLSLKHLCSLIINDTKILKQSEFVKRIIIKTFKCCHWKRVTYKSMLIAAKYGHLKCLIYIYNLFGYWHPGSAFFAAKYGHLTCLEFITENGGANRLVSKVAVNHLPCCVYIGQKFGWSKLVGEILVIRKKFHYLEKLIDDYNYPTDNIWLVHYLLQDYNQEKILEKIVRKTPGIFNNEDSDILKSLYYSAKNNNWLSKYLQFPQITDTIVACEYGNLEALEYLIAHDAKIDYRCSLRCVDSETEFLDCLSLIFRHGGYGNEQVSLQACKNFHYKSMLFAGPRFGWANIEIENILKRRKEYKLLQKCRRNGL